MDLVFQNLTTYYNLVFEERADTRTKDWFLVHDPLPPFLILVAYVSFCLNAKKLSRKWPTYKLSGVLMIYNFALIVLSVYMTYEFFMSSYLAGYSLLCQPVDYTNSQLSLRMASVCWWYFISKYIELLDTVFFVMRKKFTQVSFLHVYHHSTMLVNWWLGVKYVAGGQAFFIGMLNSFVHVIMYSYYFLTCFGPRLQKYLWWKRYLTKLQLIQFVFIFLHSGYNLFADCDFPDWLNIMVVGYMLSLIALFLNFYIQSYLKKSK